MSGFAHGVNVQRARPYVSAWPDGRLGGRVDLSRYVTRISFSKRLDSPVGSWSLSLATPAATWGRPATILHPVELERVLATPNTVVSIGYERPGGIVLGLTDGISRTRGFTGGRVSSGLTINGSDMAKVLTQDAIVHASLTVAQTPTFLALIEAAIGKDNALNEPITGVWGPQNRNAKAKVFEGAQIVDVASWVLDSATAMRVPLLSAFGGSGRAGEWLGRHVTTWHPAQFIYSDGPKNFNGSFYGFLKSVVDEDFYEVIVDSLWPPNPAGLSRAHIPDVWLTIRPKPFDEGIQRWLPVPDVPPLTWDNMRTRIQQRPGFPTNYWRIDQTEVLRESFSVSDTDLFSYFEVTSDTDLIGTQGQRNDGLYYPLADLSAMRRAGVRSYQGRLSLVDPYIGPEDRTYTGVLPSDLKAFRNRLLNWYRLADWYETGSITVVGHDHYRVGDKVFLPYRRPARGATIAPPGMYYYVVGTEFAWSIGGGYTTTLTLTRGHCSSQVQEAGRRFAAESLQVLGTPGKMLAET